LNPGIPLSLGGTHNAVLDAVIHHTSRSQAGARDKMRTAVGGCLEVDLAKVGD
jgi:hypothetical protein